MTRLYTTTGSEAPVYTTDGDLVWGGGSPVQPVPPEGPLRNIATGCATATIPLATTLGAAGRMVAHRTTLAVDAIEPVFEWVIQGGFGGNTPTPYTLRAAVAHLGDPPRTLTFDGETAAAIPATPTMVLTSDPAPITAHAGDVLDVYVWASGPYQGDLTGYLPDLDIGTADGTYSITMQNLTPAPAGWRTIRQSRIVAPSDVPAWILAGDSIAQQAGSFLDTAALARSIPAVKSVVGGDGYQYYPGRWESMYGQHTGFADHMVDQYGANSPDTVDALRFWRHAKANGISYLVKTTMAPRVRQDGTPPAADLAFNAWLRDGAPLTPDGTAPAEPGTVGAIRAAVIRPDGTISEGAGAHPADVISDAAAAIEDPARPGHFTAEAVAAQGSDTDWLHFNLKVHALVSARLERDLAILGY